MKLVEVFSGKTSKSEPVKKTTDSSHFDLETYNRIKTRIHTQLVDLLDLNAIADIPKESLRASIKDVVVDVTEREKFPINLKEQENIISDVLNEILGLGPIEPLMQDDTIQDILVNKYSSIYVERNGLLEKVPFQFRDDEHLMQIIDRIVAGVGRRIDESSPMVDARLSDGSRVNAIIPPLAIDGPCLSIRKFGYTPMKLSNLLERQSITPEIIEYLKGVVVSKLNLLISGGTGGGKTTLLNILSAFIPHEERVVTIEDSAELQLQQPHVVRLESRPPNIEGRGEVKLTDLVKNSLRMRPDRIIVGEVRGAEAMDMLQAMNTGHQGSMSTIHSNSARDALARLEVMVRMGALMVSENALRSLTASAINVIIHLSRLADGTRRMISVSEVTGMEGNIIAMQDLFVFDQQGVDSSGNIYGEFRATGVPSIFADHIERSGYKLNHDIFTLKLPIGKKNI